MGLLSGLLGCAKKQGISGLSLPHAAGSAHCYDSLAQAPAPYREGFADLGAALADPTYPLHERITALLAKHEDILKRGAAVAPQGGASQEDVYLCCVYDLLHAVFARETRTALEAEGSPAERRARGEAVRAELDRIGWQSPKWTQMEKPQIRAQIDQALTTVR